MIKKRFYKIVAVLLLLMNLFQVIAPTAYKCYAAENEVKEDINIVSENNLENLDSDILLENEAISEENQIDEDIVNQENDLEEVVEEDIDKNNVINEITEENEQTEEIIENKTVEEDKIEDVIENKKDSQINEEKALEDLADDSEEIEIIESAENNIMVMSGEFFIGNEAEFRNALANHADVIRVRQSIDFTAPIYIDYAVRIVDESDDNALRYGNGGNFIIVQNGGSLTLDGMVVDTNSSGVSGMTAINIENGGNVTFVRSSIVDGGLDNTGILVNSGATLTLWSSEIVRCGTGINLQGNGRLIFGTEEGRRNHFYWNKTATFIDNFNENCEFNQNNIVMHDNTDYAIHIANSSGNINIAAGEYYNNTYCVRTQNGSATVSGGSYHNNGWALWCGSNLNLTGGDIYGNYYGVLTDEATNGSFVMTGGNIHDNTAHAIQHQKENDGGCTILGGSISGDVYLEKNDNYVNTNSSYPTFTVTPSTYYFKRKLVKTTDNNCANSEIGNVTLTPRDQWYKYVDNEYIVLWQNGKITVRCYDADIPNGKVVINGNQYNEMLFIKNAAFNIVDSNGNIIQTLTTDENGYAESKELPANTTYTVMQIGGPDNYELNTGNITATFTDENFTANFPIEHKKGNLAITKVDKDDENIKLKNVTFNLYVNEVDMPYKKGDCIGTYKTDENGKIDVNNIWTGSYYFVENETLNTYNLDTTHNDIVIKDKETMNTIVTNEKKKDKIEVTVKDEDTEIPLENIKVVILDEEKNVIEELTTDENGHAISSDLPIDKEYIVIQETELDNYIKNDEETDVDFIKEFGYEDNKIYPIDITNKHKTGNIELTKTDLDTNKILEGFTFELYVDEVDKPYEKNELVGTYTTDEQGKVNIENIWNGKYYFKEVASEASGTYQLLEDKIEVIVNSDEDTVFTVKNEKQKGQIEISKKTAKDYSDITKCEAGTALEGAVFEILDEENNVVDTIETDNEGYAISERLPIDKVYTIKEKLAPEYYLENEKTETIEFKENGEIVTLEWEDEAVKLKVKIEHTGVAETQANTEIKYEITTLENQSNVNIDEFVLIDEIPYEYVKLNTLYTGTYNYEHDYEVYYKVVDSDEWKLIGTYNTTKNNAIDFTGIAEDITSFKINFGTVEKDFVANKDEMPLFLASVKLNVDNQSVWENEVKLIGQYVSNRENKIDLLDNDVVKTKGYAKELTIDNGNNKNQNSNRRTILPKTGY